MIPELTRAALLAASLALVSCRTAGFYSQAVSGQFEILAKARPVEHVAATTRDPVLRDRLELTKRLLEFAETHLDMPARGSYASYADLGRDHVVWVVHAAPELSLEPKRWWYPVVGCQDYRGFFSPEAAEEEAARLRNAGYETWTTRVDAYSTLGFLRDPLLNTFIHRPEADLAQILFHELAHQKYYVHGNTRFNEAMAEAVSREGVRRWFLHTGRPDKAENYAKTLRRLRSVVKAIQTCAAELETAYQTPAPDNRKREWKTRALNRLRSKLRALRGQWGYGLKSWLDEPVNNARINSFTTYEEDIPRFDNLLRECGGDFPLFWERVRHLEP